MNRVGEQKGRWTVRERIGINMWMALLRSSYIYVWIPYIILVACMDAQIPYLILEENALSPLKGKRSKWYYKIRK